jgi:hypothetical protein
MTRIFWLCRAGSLAILVSLALPAAAGAPERPGGGAGAAGATAAPAQLSRRDAQLLIGRPVETPQRVRIGRADDVLFDSHGEINAVVVALGGLLGIGERKVAIGRGALRISAEGRAVVVTMTPDQLAQAPTYRERQGERLVGADGRAGAR